MFKRIFEVCLLPVPLVTGLAAVALYFYVSIYLLLNEDVTAGVIWLLIWGHVFSVLLSIIFVGLPLSLMATLVAGTVWVFVQGWRFQGRTIQSLPIEIRRKKE